MLQQTQTERVAPKYRAFLKRFPNFRALARSPLADVLRVWQGLGYNRRALALKNLSKIVVTKYNGRLPRDPETLISFPGIGPATAGAVMAFAFNIPSVFIETNIRRVMIHVFFRRKHQVHDREIVAVLERSLDRKNPRLWYWALMDYGAMLGTLSKNPNQKSVHYRAQSPFIGSHRQLRGKVLTVLLAAGPLDRRALYRAMRVHTGRVREVLMELVGEGFIRQRKSHFVIV